MRTLTRTAPLLVLLIAMPGISFAATSRTSLDDWLQNDLIPSLARQLSDHPRFRDEVLRFVILDNGRPAPVSNGLALALRDKMQDAMIDRTSIRIGWRPEAAGFDAGAGHGRVDCTTSEVHYFVGLELTETRPGKYSVAVRVLDVSEQNWVSGIGGNWHGALTAMQQRAYRSVEVDPAWLGQRVSPFEDSQVDLLAARLAHDLGCSLLREMSGEYVAQPAPGVDEPVEDMLALVSNNLAPYRALQISTVGTGNSTLTTRAHRVDGDLYQYWVTVTPDDTDSDMPAVSASAYIYLPDQFQPPMHAAATRRRGHTSEVALLESFEVVRLTGQFHQPERDYALQAVTDDDAVLFFLYHQLNNGLVRLSDSGCRGSLRARISRGYQPVQFPLQLGMSANPEWLPGDDWQTSPDTDAFYVVGTGNSRAGSALARHIEQLPVRCGSSLRPGVEGAELRRWFRELEAIAERWPGEIDWKSVRVKEIY